MFAVLNIGRLLKPLVIISPLFALCVSSYAAAEPLSFSQAKKALAKIYHDHTESFYCGCSIDTESKKWVPELDKCGYSPRKNAKRAERIEWEHVMPAWAFGHQLQCWQEGGRKGCRKEANFKVMEGDMHNLVPAIGEVNGDRSNYRFTMLEGEARVYGSCDMEVDFKRKAVEPPEQVRGDIARTYFYMRDTYKLSLSKKETQLLNAWHKLDPVDEWELARNQRIYQVQGNLNPYVVKEEKGVYTADLATVAELPQAAESINADALKADVKEFLTTASKLIKLLDH